MLGELPGSPRDQEQARERAPRHETTRVLVRGAETGGRFAIVERVETRERPAFRHLHTGEDELLYVLEGQLTVRIGDEERVCSAGSCVLQPRGREHSHRVDSDVARLLLIVAPAGLEELFAGQQWDPKQELERLVTLAAHHGVVITGPADDPQTT